LEFSEIFEESPAASRGGFFKDFAKGLEDLDVPLKMRRLRQWCEDINRVQAAVEYDFVYVDQEGFEKYHPTSFRQLRDSFKEYKAKP
jgi:hypothetical protein